MPRMFYKSKKLLICFSLQQKAKPLITIFSCHQSCLLSKQAFFILNRPQKYPQIWQQSDIKRGPLIHCQYNYWRKEDTYAKSFGVVDRIALTGLLHTICNKCELESRSRTFMKGIIALRLFNIASASKVQEKRDGGILIECSKRFSKMGSF